MNEPGCSQVSSNNIPSPSGSSYNPCDSLGAELRVCLGVPCSSYLDTPRDKRDKASQAFVVPGTHPHPEPQLMATEVGGFV